MGCVLSYFSSEGCAENKGQLKEKLIPPDEDKESPPGQTLLAETEPGHTGPAEAESGHTGPGEAEPGQVTRGEREPGETLLRETDREPAKHGGTEPGQTLLGETEPEQAKHGDIDLGEPERGETATGKPGETKPGHQTAEEAPTGRTVDAASPRDRIPRHSDKDSAERSAASSADKTPSEAAGPADRSPSQHGATSDGERPLLGALGAAAAGAATVGAVAGALDASQDREQQLMADEDGSGTEEPSREQTEEEGDKVVLGNSGENSDGERRTAGAGEKAEENQVEQELGNESLQASESLEKNNLQRDEGSETEVPQQKEVESRAGDSPVMSAKNDAGIQSRNEDENELKLEKEQPKGEERLSSEEQETNDVVTSEDSNEADLTADKSPAEAEKRADSPNQDRSLVTSPPAHAAGLIAAEGSQVSKEPESSPRVRSATPPSGEAEQTGPVGGEDDENSDVLVGELSSSSRGVGLAVEDAFREEGSRTPRTSPVESDAEHIPLSTSGDAEKLTRSLNNASGATEAAANTDENSGLEEAAAGKDGSTAVPTPSIKSDIEAVSANDAENPADSTENERSKDQVVLDARRKLEEIEAEEEIDQPQTAEESVADANNDNEQANASESDTNEAENQASEQLPTAAPEKDLSDAANEQEPKRANEDTPSVIATKANTIPEVETPKVVPRQRISPPLGSEQWRELERDAVAVPPGQARSVSQLSGVQDVHAAMADERVSVQTPEDEGADADAGQPVGEAEVEIEAGLEGLAAGRKSPAPSVAEEPIVKVDRFASEEKQGAEVDQAQGGGEETDRPATPLGDVQQGVGTEAVGLDSDAQKDIAEVELNAGTSLTKPEEDKAISSNQAEITKSTEGAQMPANEADVEKKDISSREALVDSSEMPNEDADFSERTEDIEFDPLAVTQSMIFPDEVETGRDSQLSEKPSSPFPAVETSQGDINFKAIINEDENVKTEEQNINQPEEAVKHAEALSVKSEDADSAAVSDAAQSDHADAKTPESDDSSATSNAAATKIQAGVRGWQVRRKISQQQAAATQIQAGFRGWKVRRDRRMRRSSSLPNLSQDQPDAPAGEFMDVDELKSRAAAKIQAGFRGWKTRQEMKSLAPPAEEDNAPLSVVDSLALNDDISPAISMSNISPQEQAALKIQAGYRGWKTRKDLKRSLSDPNSEALELALASHQATGEERINTDTHPTTSPEAPTPREEDETAHSIQSIQSEVASSAREGTTPTPAAQPADGAASSDPGDRADEGAQSPTVARPTVSAKSVTDSGALPIDYAIVHRPEDDWVAADLEKLDREKAEREHQQATPPAKDDDSDSTSSWLTRAQTDIRASFQGLRENVSDALRTVEQTATMVREQGAGAGAEPAAPVAVNPAVKSVQERGAGAADEGERTDSSSTDTLLQSVVDSGTHVGQTDGNKASSAVGDQAAQDSHGKDGARVEGEGAGAGDGVDVTSPSNTEDKEQEIWEEIQRSMQLDM